MSISITDASGNPVIPTGAVASPDQQVADSSGNIISPSTEETLLAIKTQTDKLNFTGANLQTTAAVDLSATSVGIEDAAYARINPSKEDGNLALIKAKTDNIDVLLSTRATEATLALIKAKTDNIDVALSTRTKPADSQNVTGTVIVTQATGTSLHAVVDSGTITSNQGTAAALAAAWPVQVTDGTSVVAVKAASTAAVAADPAQVVSLSPNSPVPAGLNTIGTVNLGTTAGGAGQLSLDATLAKLTIGQGAALGANTMAMMGAAVLADHPTYTTDQISPLSQTTEGRLRVSMRGDTSFASGSLGALNAAVSISVYGQPSVTFMLNGTFSGTIVAEGTPNGTNWFTAHSAPVASQIGTSSIVLTGTTTNAPYFVLPLPLNCVAYRLRVSAYTSGSLDAAIIENDIDRFMMIMGATHDGLIRQPVSVDRAFNYNNMSTVAMDFCAHETSEMRTYSMTAEFTLPSGGTETPAFLISNPAGNTKMLVLYRISLDVFTDGGFSRNRIYANPTGTITGTAATIVNRNIGGGAAPSTMTGLVGPLTGITANGSRIDLCSTDSRSGSEIDYHFNTIIQPGSRILITGQPEANSRILAATITWSEITI